MKLLPLVVFVLLTAGVAYYVYVPLPDAIEEPWKLMMLGAVIRGTNHLVRVIAWLTGDHYVLLLRQTQASAVGSDPNTGATPGVKISDITFAGIPVRVYEPVTAADGRLRRGIMYYHGGGWALGSAKSREYDQVSRMMSEELNTVLVSVEYRLYPEVHFPVPYLDCLTAAKHFLSPEVLASYMIDPERVAVAGDSAGGNLAAAVSQEIAIDDTVSVKFSLQALIYPVLQALDFNTPSYLQNQHIPLLFRPAMVRFWLQYLGADLSLKHQAMANNHTSHVPPELKARVDWTVLLPPKHKKGYKPLSVEKSSQGAGKEVPGLLDVRAAPLLADAEVLAKCPRAYILVCEHDVLRDDGLMYARRLQDAGVKVTTKLYEDGYHGVFSLVEKPFDFKVARKVIRETFDWLKNNL